MRKKPPTHAQTLKAMISVVNPTETRLQHIKLPVKRKKRAKETVPRRQPEAEFRQEVFRFLRRDSRIWDYKRIENGMWGIHSRGIPDFMFWTSTSFYWLELKAKGENLKPEQEDFKEHCTRTNINHITAWTIEDIEDAITKGAGR